MSSWISNLQKLSLKAINWIYKTFFAGGVAIVLLIVVIAGLLTPDEKAEPGETSDFSIKEPSLFSDVNGFESDNSTFNLDAANGYGEKIATDRSGAKHERAVFIINEFSEDSNLKDPYILLEIGDFKGKLKEYDSFKTTLSINPEQRTYEEGLNYDEILWGTNESDQLNYLAQIKSKMTFSFMNEDDEILGKYTIDSNNALPIEVDLKKSKRLFIVVESDYKDFFVGGLYSPTLVKK